MQNNVHGTAANASKLNNQTADYYKNPDNFSKAVPVSKGGTGQTGVLKQKVNLSKNGSITFKKFGNVVYAYGTATIAGNTQMLNSNTGSIPTWARINEQNAISVSGETGYMKILKTGTCSITLVHELGQAETEEFSISYIVD